MAEMPEEVHYEFAKVHQLVHALVGTGIGAPIGGDQIEERVSLVLYLLGLEEHPVQLALTAEQTRWLVEGLNHALTELS